MNSSLRLRTTEFKTEINLERGSPLDRMNWIDMIRHILLSTNHFSSYGFAQRMNFKWTIQSEEWTSGYRNFLIASWKFILSIQMHLVILSINAMVCLIMVSIMKPTSSANRIDAPWKSANDRLSSKHLFGNPSELSNAAVTLVSRSWWPGFQVPL